MKSSRKITLMKFAQAAAVSLVAFCLFSGVAGSARAQASAFSKDSLTPYVISGQLDLPMPRWSVLKQPWRAYAQTVPALTYLRGLGVMWGDVPSDMNANSLANILKTAGFSRVRYEVSWGAINWDETGLNSAQQSDLTAVMAALRAHGLRPLILLNAHHLRPCPIRNVRTFTLSASAAAGEDTLKLSGDFSNLPAGRTEIISLTTSRQAGPLVTQIDQNELKIKLSRPLSQQLEAGSKITLAELKYLPLYPVGTAQFDETLMGWKKYVALATDAVRKAYGSDDFDVEIWNELSFGSAFLNVNNYYPAESAVKSNSDFLRRGGTAWTLADEAAKILKANHPAVKVIWGFSNTTFFHTPVTELPPNLSGQSYHPYNAAPRCLSQNEQSALKSNADPYFQDLCAAIPESIFATFMNTATLFRLINPDARANKPAGSNSFDHFITEHGESASDFRLDSIPAQRMKAKFQLRAPAFWLNKGVTAFYTYHAYDKTDTKFGIMSAQPGSKSIALDALERMTSRFSDAVPIKDIRKLYFEYASLDTSVTVFSDKKNSAKLTHKDLVQILPYQINTHHFVIPMYVMAWNFPQDLAPESYEIVISGVNGNTANLKLYDPLIDKEENISIRSRTKNSVTLHVPLTDSVRLLELTD